MPIDVEEATRQADALLQGAIGEFSKPLVVPTSTPIDLTRAEETLNRAEVTGGEHAQTLRESEALFKAATEQEKAAIGKGGEAKAAGELAIGARQKEEAAGYQYYQRLFGMDIAPDAAIANAAHRQTEIRKGMEAKLDRVNRLKSVSLFDNPIEFMLNTMELPGAIEDYNIDVTKVNNLQQSIDDGIQSARNAGDLNNKGIPTITDSMAAANANIALAEAAKKKADADQKLATTSVDFASKKLATDIALAHATRETTQLEMQNEKLKYETLVNAVRLADTHAVRLEGAAKLLYDLADKASLDVLLKQYDRNAGNPVGTTNRQLFNRLPAQERENIAAIGAGSAGTNPYEFLKNFQHPGPLLSPETRRLFEFVQSEARTTQLPANTPKELREQTLGDALKKKVTDAMVNGYKQGSLFFEMSPAKMIAANAVPMGSKLEEILTPLAKIEGPVPTNVIIEAISKAYPNPTEAGSVISDYYKANIALRNKSLNMSLMGMRPLETYKVPIKSYTFMNTPFGGHRDVFDLTRPEEATKYLIINNAEKRTAEIFPGTGTPGKPQASTDEEGNIRNVALEDMTPEQLSAEARRRTRAENAKKDMPEVDQRRLPPVEEGILNEIPADAAKNARRIKKVST